MRVAQTNLQLYNQLRERGMPLGDMVLVHRAYELLISLYTGCFQGDDKPFVAHGIGTASILAEIGQPAEVLAFGMLHNVYGNGIFGDRDGPGPTPKRRRLVREAMGERIESLIADFPERRANESRLDDIRAAVPELDADHRMTLLVDLAEHMEKYVDLGALYYGDPDWMARQTDKAGARLIALAGDLGEPELAAMMSDAFERAAAEADRVPPELRPSDSRRYMKLVVPRSCRPRFRTSPVTRVRRRLKLRTRVRAVRAALAR
jgi:hypothetical protein